MTDLKSYEASYSLALSIVKGAQLNFAVHGYAAPMSFFIAQRDALTCEELKRPEILPVPLGRYMSDKDKVRFLQQKLIERTDALAHVFVSEAWKVETSPEGFEDLSGSLEHHPQRKEIISVTLEHISGRTATWEVLITRDADGHGNLGEAVEVLYDNNVGRMSGYFKATHHTEVEA